MHGGYRSVWTELLATPFRQGWLDAGGIKTRFVQAGSESNPPLVMLHGTAGMMWRIWPLRICAPPISKSSRAVRMPRWVGAS